MGCNLRCSFCGIAGIQEKQGHGYKFMAEATMRSAMEQVAELGWNSRIGFAMRGDPTQHPNYAGMVAITHEHRPRSTKLMLTNAGGLLRKPGAVANVNALFDAGLTILGLDHYQNIEYVPKVLTAMQGNLQFVSGEKYSAHGGQQFNFYEYPYDSRGNPHARYKPGTRMLVRIKDIAWTEKTDKKGNHNRLSNHAGAGAPPNDRMQGKRCALPFRQLAIHWDGSVAVCCNDWRGEYHCGNILTDGIEAIWNGPAFGAAREALYAGRRDMLRPCKGCDHRSFRVGILPNYDGSGTLRRPDAQTREEIARVNALSPQTKPVLRPWEER
jgi:radical SAM protein with 4Fe4S-binding SPASM domain